MIHPLVNQTPGVLSLFLRIGGKDFLLGMVILIVMTAVSYSQLVTAHRFATEGVKTVAQVERAYTSERRRDGRTVTGYHLDLSFATESRRRVAVSEKVDRDFYGRTGPGESLDLWYLPSEPDTVELIPDSFRNKGRMAQWFALFMGVIWLGILWFSGRKAVAGYLARQHGRKGKGTVLRVDTIQTRREGTWYRLVWRDDAGREGKSLKYRAGRLERFEPGSTLSVYHGPKRSWWIGDVGVRSAEQS
ncbi:DUF3592 domain-containing protein [Roseovarius sp. THAF9]|uniref:DUF3592 domain-containing protein n=1 Tax=Roseovarius sp. THAF9 TaxID=2587847 RepID=UPI0012682F6F